MKKNIILLLFIIALVSSFYLLLNRKLVSNQKFKDIAVNIPTIVNKPSQTPIITNTPKLPEKYLIRSVFVPQAPEKNWDQPWQDACEEAALLTVVYYYQPQPATISNMVAEYESIFDFEAKSGWSHDINITEMSIIANQMYGLRSVVVSSPTVETIKDYLIQDKPIIVPANGKMLYKENKHFKSGGPWYHNLVILGYDDNKKQFIVHDVGTQFGAYYHYSYNLLMDSIHDFPENRIKEDINLGKKNVLVLLK